MQWRYVIEFLAEHEEDGIGELGELRDEVPPGYLGHPHGLAGGAAVDGLTSEGVIAPPAAR